MTAARLIPISNFFCYGIKPLDSSIPISDICLIAMADSAGHPSEDGTDDELFVRQPGDVTRMGDTIDLTNETPVESDARLLRVANLRHEIDLTGFGDETNLIKQEPDDDIPWSASRNHPDEDDSGYQPEDDKDDRSIPGDRHRRGKKGKGKEITADEVTPEDCEAEISEPKQRIEDLRTSVEEGSASPASSQGRTLPQKSSHPISPSLQKKERGRMGLSNKTRVQGHWREENWHRTWRNIYEGRQVGTNHSRRDSRRETRPSSRYCKPRIRLQLVNKCQTFH
ncbi:hypothetical protein B0H63DRAFT_108045 [Podospora didyma]|uniref:Uncharacterized protein n=1 Tax=Podospora didyma TaxID=330526 RepID=A0AAE0U409_9PEZI|nr:hypothetical protein B0H63DRAFT_108045 [Podospora didyma]